eukprot:MONOS_3734.1-p1 / transcript=MONOS_3734.1 / gene=MONOS_3734 / organism=Monocercomonoides_exilis_PA203 / gene_product=unspecified product / transcript_product=unspecified product / location=Mono_scaffold00091:15817-16617(+) / protein_length=267 / sequence_SO=supercontig / SO=protein_coding / is_pseudo=false
MLSETCVKYEAQVAELAQQIRELKEQHEETKQEIEKRYSEFNMLLQKIRDDERISKRTSGLAEQLQEKYKIIRMWERKILELSEKNNEEVKELQEQLVAMKEKAALIDVGIEKEKKRRTQQGGVVSEDSEGTGSGADSGAGAGVPLATPSSLSSAGGVVIPSSASLILPSGLCEKCQEKLSEIINDGSAVMLGPDLNGKGVVAKVWRGVSVVGEANSGGGGGGGRVDATVQQKMNETEKENEDADSAVESAGADNKRAEGAVQGGD